MACPFLTEGRARYCVAAPVRKLILDGPGVAGGGLCTSPEYKRCKLADKNAAQEDRCPHLEEVLVQYCSASPITKLVPCNESQSSICSGEGYRFCESYLAIARPHHDTPPPNLFYSANHFWLDAEQSGFCHIGIDMFLAEVAGSIEGVTYATDHGTHCPGLALTVHGLEWPMSFPNPLIIQRVNGRVRSDPATLTADPFGAGWLFEGWEVPGRTRAGLITGRQAEAWQADERECLAREIHDAHVPGCDGGAPVRGVARLLSRPHLVCLFQRFFSKRSWMAEE